MRSTVLTHCLFKLSLERNHLTLVDLNLHADILGLRLEALGDFAVRDSKFALDVSILVILLKASSLGRSCHHLVGQTSKDDIQFAHLFLNLAILVV